MDDGDGWIMDARLSVRYAKEEQVTALLHAPLSQER